jgi:hypothetical protein
LFGYGTSLSTCSGTDIRVHSRDRQAVFHNFSYPTTFPQESRGLEYPFREAAKAEATLAFSVAYYDFLLTNIVVERFDQSVNEGSQAISFPNSSIRTGNGSDLGRRRRISIRSPNKSAQTRIIALDVRLLDLTIQPSREDQVSEGFPMKNFEFVEID